MRGERNVNNAAVQYNVGSSPHAWGTDIADNVSSKDVRFIPTCVGNGRRIKSAQRITPVHPHMRGERIQKPMLVTGRCGSSPHAWGTDGVTMQHDEEWRFIPTCVGNGAMAASRAWYNAVHPHMRGERFNWRLLWNTDNGSSPHAWGTGEIVTLEWENIRFIPTCVGNGGIRLSANLGDPVHPHMRGERLHNPSNQRR